MGLIKAAMGAAGGTMADQWKEFFSCDAFDADILVAKGEKKISGRSSNRKGEPNVITDGSRIVVADGQCMIIVENGKVLDVCAEPGGYVYDQGSGPSVFGGTFMDGLSGAVREAWERFQFGGGAGKDQRIYYVNIKEIPGNKYGTPNPVPFRVVDRNIGLDVDISIRCNGEYSYRIVNPMLFYANVCGNVSSVYTRDQIDAMLKSELLTALQPAFARISGMGIRYSELPGHTLEMADALNEILSQKWTGLRGIQVVSFGVNSVTASKEDEEMIKQLQRTAVMRDPGMAAAALAGAQADAMRTAASNKSGAMMGFMGMDMAQKAGGANVQDLFAMEQQQAAMRTSVRQADVQNGRQPEGKGWTCSCGTAGNTGKFCVECGSPRPSEGWTCSCGAAGNTGKFCAECGSPRPPQSWTCSCGTVNKGKFCTECGAEKSK